MMKAEEAIKKLQELITELSQLPQYTFSENNFEFPKWHRKCKLAVKNIFGYTSTNLSEFIKIEFVPLWVNCVKPAVFGEAITLYLQSKNVRPQ